MTTITDHADQFIYASSYIIHKMLLKIAIALSAVGMEHVTGSNNCRPISESIHAAILSLFEVATKQLN